MSGIEEKPELPSHKKKSGPPSGKTGHRTMLIISISIEIVFSFNMTDCGKPEYTHRYLLGKSRSNFLALLDIWFVGYEFQSSGDKT